VQVRLDQDYGGFLTEQIPFDIPALEQPNGPFWQFVESIDDPEGPCDHEIALDPGLYGLPTWMPASAQRSCDDGLVHGRWKPLGHGVGVFFGMTLDRNRGTDRSIVGVYGRGQVYGAIVGSGRTPQHLLAGRYVGNSFRVVVLDRQQRRVGTLRGEVRGRQFGGKWSRRCSEACPPCPPHTERRDQDCHCEPRDQPMRECQREPRPDCIDEPQPECLTEVLHLGCASFSELQTIGEDFCGGYGLLLAGVEPLTLCEAPAPSPMPYPTPYADAGMPDGSPIGPCSDERERPGCDAGMPYPTTPEPKPSTVAGARIVCCGARPPQPPPSIPGACMSTVIEGSCLPWQLWQERTYDFCATRGMAPAGFERNRS
jgi:hypothetical protein